MFDAFTVVIQESSGALVNIDREAGGINATSVLVVDRVSFVVRMDSVTKIVNHLEKNGYVIKFCIG